MDRGQGPAAKNWNRELPSMASPFGVFRSGRGTNSHCSPACSGRASCQAQVRPSTQRAIPARFAAIHREGGGAGYIAELDHVGAEPRRGAPLVIDAALRLELADIRRQGDVADSNQDQRPRGRHSSHIGPPESPSTTACPAFSLPLSHLFALSSTGECGCQVDVEAPSLRHRLLSDCGASIVLK